MNGLKFNENAKYNLIAPSSMGVRITPVDRTEVYTCDEAFLCGSAMEVTPILSVDKYDLGEPVLTERLHKAYLETVTGKNKKHCDWVTPIYG